MSDHTNPVHQFSPVQSRLLCLSWLCMLFVLSSSSLQNSPTLGRVKFAKTEWAKWDGVGSHHLKRLRHKCVPHSLAVMTNKILQIERDRSYIPAMSD